MNVAHSCSSIWGRLMTSDQFHVPVGAVQGSKTTGLIAQLCLMRRLLNLFSKPHYQWCAYKASLLAISESKINHGDRAPRYPWTVDMVAMRVCKDVATRKTENKQFVYSCLCEFCEGTSLQLPGEPNFEQGHLRLMRDVQAASCFQRFLLGSCMIGVVFGPQTLAWHG